MIINWGVGALACLVPAGACILQRPRLRRASGVGSDELSQRAWETYHYPKRRGCSSNMTAGHSLIKHALQCSSQANSAQSCPCYNKRQPHQRPRLENARAAISFLESQFDALPDLKLKTSPPTPSEKWN